MRAVSRLGQPLAESPPLLTAVTLFHLIACFFPLTGRQRRGRVPYFGQDLDKLGVVRAVPVMKGPNKSQDSALPSFMKGMVIDLYFLDEVVPFPAYS